MISLSAHGILDLVPTATKLNLMESDTSNLVSWGWLIRKAFFCYHEVIQCQPHFSSLMRLSSWKFGLLKDLYIVFHFPSRWQHWCIILHCTQFLCARAYVLSLIVTRQQMLSDKISAISPFVKQLLSVHQNPQLPSDPLHLGNNWVMTFCVEPSALSKQRFLSFLRTKFGRKSCAGSCVYSSSVCVCSVPTRAHHLCNPNLPTPELKISIWSQSHLWRVK